ncbi:MAG: hypothetical protein LLG08_00295 [Actinomycetia bacterium]|nr:hypothetical protein [Actinomycetes bacterium]
MIGLLIGALLASGATAYAIGYAFIMPPESFFRTKVGMLVLVTIALTFPFLPPQLMSMGSSLGGLGDQLGSGLAGALAWPAGLNREVYRFSWIGLMIVGLLTGMRIWNARDPDWRRSGASLDASSASRAEKLLPLADSLQDALETLGRARLTPRDAERLAPQLQAVGRRFGHQLPERNSAAYNLIVRHVSAAVAAIVTGHILEGAVRTGRTTREE